MFGRQAVLPVDFIGSTKPCSEEVLQDFKCSLYSKHTEERKKLLEVVKANIVKAQVKQKEQYDRKHHKLEVFNIGSIVLKKDFLRKKRAHGKLDKKWVGPYKITNFLGRGIYSLELVEDPSKVVNRVNGVHLKPYHQRMSTSLESYSPTSPASPNSPASPISLLASPISLYSEDNFSPYPQKEPPLSLLKEKNVSREPVSLSPETVAIPSNSNTSSTTSLLNKRNVTSDYSRTSKHARLPSAKSVVKQLMFSKRQANVSSVKSDVIEVEKYTLKTNQRLQYWLSNLKLTEADKELLLSPIGWLNDSLINAAQQLLKSKCSQIAGFQDVTCGFIIQCGAR